jgi:predicted enzyme related to lactoylglutathione lyase
MQAGLSGMSTERHSCRLRRLDHLVLTVADIRRTCAFYAQVLGTRVAISWKMANETVKSSGTAGD